MMGKLKKRLTFEKILILCVFFRFATTTLYFFENGKFKLAKMEINHELFRISKDSQLSQKAMPFTTLNIAHELIHVLVANTFGLNQPKNQTNQHKNDGNNKPDNAKITPEKAKFQVKVA